MNFHWRARRRRLKAWRQGALLPLIHALRNPQIRRYFVYLYQKHGHLPLTHTRLRATSPWYAKQARPLRLLFISDLHLRGHPIEKFLLARLAHMTWDVLLLGGDYTPEPGTDPGGRRALDFFARLRVVARGRPVIAVPGNHDPDRLIRGMRRLGIRVLKDQTVLLESMPKQGLVGIIGTRDPHRDRPDWTRIGASKKAATQTVPWIVVAHSPDILIDLPADPDILLVLSGHTHGGQISLGHDRPLWSNTRISRQYAIGLAHLGDTWIYTSRGFGYTLAPLRVFCPPEIVEIYLQHGAGPRVMLDRLFPTFVAPEDHGNLAAKATIIFSR